MRKFGRLSAAFGIVAAISITPAAAASPKLIKCPDNTHIWAESRSECFPDHAGSGGITLGGGGGNRECGGICGILRGLPGIGSLF